MLYLLFITLIIVCVVLIFFVLIQAPKGRGLDSGMGGAAANQLLGASQSADIVERITWGLAAGVAAICLVVALMVAPKSATQAKAPQTQQQQAPAKK